MLVQLNLKEFCDRLGDGKPTPGGGTASAVAGAMGAGLVAMFCRVTAGRKKYADVKEEMEQVAARADEWRHQLLALADRDSAAFDKVLAANRLPKETEEERQIRKQAIDSATLEATRVPLETATVCADMLEQAWPLAAKGNPNALSDLKVGMELLWTACQGAMANVEINLPWLSEADAQGIRTQVQHIIDRALQALEKGREGLAARQ